MFYQEDASDLMEIESISKYNSCPKCQQKMECSDKQKIFRCVYSAIMKRRILSPNWVLKTSCLQQNGEILCFTIFTDSLKKLIPEKRLEGFVPKKLLSFVLETEFVQYDPDKSITTDIERI